MFSLGGSESFRFGIDFEFPFDGYDSIGEGCRFAGVHFDEDAIVEHRTGAEATFLVVANQDELLDTRLLEDRCRKHEAADLDGLLVELLDIVGKHGWFEVPISLDLEFEIIKGEVPFFAIGFPLFLLDRLFSLSFLLGLFLGLFNRFLRRAGEGGWKCRRDPREEC